MAGLFYPAASGELEQVIRNLLAGVPREQRRIRGAIVPHAGLIYSGACAAQVWGRVAIPDTVVVAGPNHRGRIATPGGAGGWTHGAFATPLGETPAAEAFMARLEAASPLVAHDGTAHEREHAIEVQLPFLQVLAPTSAMAPLLLAFDDWRRCRVLAEALAGVIRDWSGEVLLVASSDMTHYESAASAERKDRLAFDAILRLDGEALLDVCRRARVSMCGRAAAATVLEAARLLGATRAEVVDYRHSGMVTGDHDDVVAYAGVIVE